MGSNLSSGPHYGHQLDKNQNDQSFSKTSSNPTIVDIAAADGRFSTLVAALKAANLAGTLSGKGPFTVFAPTDAAFMALPPGTVDGLLKDIPALTDVLTYHVVPGKVLASDVVKLASAKTLEGDDVNVTTSGGNVYINKSRIIQTDVIGSNGVIHVVDSVLLPPSKEQKRENTMKKLDVYLYSGEWWEIAKYPLIWESDCERATANYSYDSFKNVIKVTNICWVNGQVIRTRTGEARMDNMNDKGKLRLNFTDGLPSDGESDYWVHWTDYTSYAIVGGRDGKYLWVLSRKEKMPRGDIDMIINKVKSYGYDTDRLIAAAGAVEM